MIAVARSRGCGVSRFPPTALLRDHETSRPRNPALRNSAYTALFWPVMRVPIRSRFGNVVLGFLGVLYFLSALGTLVYYVMTTWGASSMIDRILQFCLLASALVGAFFVVIAAQNLGLSLPGKR